MFGEDIHALGRQRGPRLGGSQEEREHTLNHIVVEMELRHKNTNVIGGPPTHRADVVDPALLRPGLLQRGGVSNRPHIGAHGDISKPPYQGRAVSTRRLHFKGSRADSRRGFSGPTLWETLVKRGPPLRGGPRGETKKSYPVRGEIFPQRPSHPRCVLPRAPEEAPPQPQKFSSPPGATQERGIFSFRL